MSATINTRELREQLELDHPILMRPHTTDPEVVREMVARGLDRRNTKRPSSGRREED